MGKISPEEKIQWIEKIIQNKESISSVAAKTGVHYMTVDKWIRNYKSIGQEAFFRKGWTKRTTEEKEAAVLDYLSGIGSLRDVCDKYRIADTRQLRKWIMKYNGHERSKSSGTGGKNIMTKGRSTTFEERVEIASFCVSHNHNYAETAEKYKVSYQQARNYTIKYEAYGIAGLTDNRGKRKSEDELTEVEKLRAELKLEKAKRQRAEMEASS